MNLRNVNSDLHSDIKSIAATEKKTLQGLVCELIEERIKNKDKVIISFELVNDDGKTCYKCFCAADDTSFGDYCLLFKAKLKDDKRLPECIKKFGEKSKG